MRRIADVKTLGSELKRLRLARGLDQHDLTGPVGKTQGTISAWEAGKGIPADGLLKYLAQVRAALFLMTQEAESLSEQIADLDPEEREDLAGLVRALRSEDATVRSTVRTLLRLAAEKGRRTSAA